MRIALPHARRAVSFVLAATLAAATVGAVSVTLSASPATAASQLRLPIAAGQTWYVCQGYRGSVSHAGDPAIDITTEPNSKGTTGCTGNASAAAGKSIYSPGAGTLHQVSHDYGGVCVTLNSGGSIYLGHLVNRRANGPVSAGTKIGEVAAVGKTNNGGYAHVHISARSGAGCGGSKVPFADANGKRFAGAPNMTSSGAVNQWAGTKLAIPATTKAFTKAPTPSVKATTLGSKLSATAGTWSPTATLRYQWLRNNASLSGATATTYKLSNSDYLKTVKVRVTGSRSGYTTASKTSSSWFVSKVTSAGGTKYVNVRSGPSTASTYIGRANAGALVALRCYKNGTSVKGPYGTSKIWYQIPGVGWVSDALLETGANSAVTPACS